MEVMTFNIDKDRRNLVDDKQNFNIDFHDSKYNWLQARQYEESMRQVEVHVVHGNGSPVDLTGMNPVFEGWMPEGLYRIIDAKHSVMIDAQNGIFRFDFPAPAFQIAGSYKQAFFRLMKDGMSVTTLEFSLEVLADKVISGLIPSDYITPFEDLYDKIEEIYKTADGKFDEQLLAWKNQFNKIIGDLNGDYIKIKATADALDSRLTVLEQKIKDDGLLTQADFDVLKNDLLNRMNIVEHQDIFNYRNKLKYKTISATIYNDSETISNDQLNHIQATGADLTLVTMVTVDNANDSSPTDISDTTFNDLIDRANKIGLKIGMLKPHIGIAGEHDSFGRDKYDPDNYDTFFENWKDLMLHYADLANANGIPILSIGCEMKLCTDTKYLVKWQDIYNSIKTKYPDLLITYAMSMYEFEDPENSGQISSVVDLIGLNVYPAYVPANYDATMKVDELKGAWWHDWNGHEFMQSINGYYDRYQKPIYITETGLTPYDDGLSRLVSDYNGTDHAYNFDAQAIGYKAAFEAMALNSHIIGVAIWHASKPFSFVDENNVNKVTPSEKVLTQYFKGGKS
ncbi:BppU family phage baseplate upper protein [Pediococcus acidilactici]|uniref:BppU family phage baseplate upper protein n=1 Tax=Pediococcus acidilactici TaxID=1254 RepID=UPI00232C6D7F|nr:BppU family phage baseplate upper protein [Pediococcus acidilactici]MDB8867689.1 BppU family phage baseplate upper protein [Pediococcus acidilactici]